MDEELNRPNPVLKPNHKSSPKPKSQPKKKKLVKKKVKKRIVKSAAPKKKVKRKEIIKDAINIHKSEYIPEYVDENHENFECAICTDIFKSPMVLNCGHIFCSKCIKKWKSQSNEASCPTCRKKIMSLNNIPLIQNMIETLQIKCKFSPVGCEWQGQSSQLDEHIRFCPKNPKRCPHKGCNQVMFPPDMKKHVTKCRYRLVLCKFCEKTTQFQNQQKNHSLVECLLCGQKNASCLGDSHVCNYFEKKPPKKSPPVEIEEKIEINEKIDEKSIRSNNNVNNKVCNFCNRTFPIDFIFEHKTLCSKSNKDKFPSKEIMLKDNRKSISFHVSRNKPSFDGITKIDLINADKRLLMNFAEKKDNIFSNPLRLSDSGSSSTTESSEEDEEATLLRQKKKSESMKRTVSVRFHRNNYLHLKEIKENNNEMPSSPRSRNWVASSPNESVRREPPQDRMIIGRKSKNNNLNNSPNSNKLNVNIRSSQNNVNNNNNNGNGVNIRSSQNNVNNVNNNVKSVNKNVIPQKKKEQMLELGNGDFYCPHCRDLVVGTERVDHYNVCSAFPHPCIYCLYKYPRSFISEHMSQCPHNTKKSNNNNNNNNGNDKDDKDDKDSTISNNNNTNNNNEPVNSPFEIFVQKFRNIFK